MIFGRKLSGGQLWDGVHEVTPWHAHFDCTHIFQVTTDRGLRGNHTIGRKEVDELPLARDSVLFEEASNPMLTLRLGESATFTRTVRIGVTTTDRCFRR
jgi:hypothetical protein